VSSAGCWDERVRRAAASAGREGASCSGNRGGRAARTRGTWKWRELSSRPQVALYLLEVPDERHRPQTSAAVLTA
jgi:hypothetical protein